MKEKETSKLYNSLTNVDNQFIEEAQTKTMRKNSWLKWAAMAACICLVVVAVTTFPSTIHFSESQTDPQPGGIVLSDRTTAKVFYGCEKGAANVSKDVLVYLTEEEMFAQESMYVFRGRVSGLTNITIDFYGVKEVRCIATISVEKVYQGDIIAGEQITMLLPCAIDIVGYAVEDTGVITQLECGMEGIFMPWIYDDNSYMEQNGAVLMKRDLAACGLADGMRWAFLSTDQGVLFERNAYPGAKNADNLDDIEAYVIKMLK